LERKDRLSCVFFFAAHKIFARACGKREMGEQPPCRPTVLFCDEDEGEDGHGDDQAGYQTPPNSPGLPMPASPMQHKILSAAAAGGGAPGESSLRPIPFPMSGALRLRHAPNTPRTIVRAHIESERPSSAPSHLMPDRAANVNPFTPDMSKVKSRLAKEARDDKPDFLQPAADPQPGSFSLAASPMKRFAEPTVFCVRVCVFVCVVLSVSHCFCPLVCSCLCLPGRASHLARIFLFFFSFVFFPLPFWIPSARCLSAGCASLVRA
jgi:hypothetical protein